MLRQQELGFKSKALSSWPGRSVEAAGPQSGRVRGALLSPHSPIQSSVFAGLALPGFAVECCSRWPVSSLLVYCFELPNGHRAATSACGCRLWTARGVGLLHGSGRFAEHDVAVLLAAQQSPWMVRTPEKSVHSPGPSGTLTLKRHKTWVAWELSSNRVSKMHEDLVHCKIYYYFSFTNLARTRIHSLPARRHKIYNL